MPTTTLARGISPDVARAYAQMRRNLRGVFTIAVTGTKGKTSTCEFIAQLMEASGRLTAVATTESARIGTRYVEACCNGQELYRFVARCRRAGVECLVLEMCSSMLQWNMQRAFDIDVAVLTNIGTDHIREHGNRRNYVAAKKRMFRDLKASPASPHPVAILNADDTCVREFMRSVPRGVPISLYGLRARSTITGAARRLRASHLTESSEGASFLVHGLTNRPFRCRSRAHGAFNVSNILAALACAIATGEEARDLRAKIGILIPPAGRFDIVALPGEGQPAVIVDYAHTPESLQSALTAARALFPNERVHALFGCGGDAYKEKRHLMGAVAGKFADAITLTNDNPRSEDPRAIVRGILRGIPKTKRRNVRVELDRKRAIESAIVQGNAGDVVIILGKGNEQTQEINGRARLFSDRRVARLALEARQRRASPDDSLLLDSIAAVLLDDRGELCFARNADVDLAPASLVKLMTLYVALAEIARGRARLDDNVTLSAYAALTPHPLLPCRAGTRVRLRALLIATAVGSDNVAATAIAEHISGNEAAFVARMNATARELGLTRTRFATPHGLPHRNERSTARDLARLALGLLRDFPFARAMLRRRTFSFGGRSWVRHVPLFRDPGGIAALKTGFTRDAGFNVLVAARRRQRELVAVVLGATSRTASFADGRELLRFGFAAQDRQSTVR